MPRKRKGVSGGPAAEVINLTVTDILKYQNDAKKFLDKDRIQNLVSATKTKSDNQQYNGKKTKFWIKDKATGTNFSCRMRSMPCCAKSNKGNPCRRKVVKGLFLCFQHTTSLLGLRVDQSKINPSMQGLFICSNNHDQGEIVFRKNDEICPYFGEIISKKTLDQRYHGKTTAPYALQITANKFIDSACLQSIGAKANTGRGTFKNNAKFRVQHSRPFARIVATKNIKNGEEVFVSYGGAYKLDGTQKSGVKPKQKVIKKKKKC